MTKPPPKKKSPRSRRTIGHLVLVAIAVVVCFYPVTKYFFLQDDFILLANAAYDRDSTVMSTFGGDSDLFRPLTKILYFGVMYQAFGLDPVPYHLVSLAVHLVNIVLLFLLLRKLRNDRLSSLIVTSLFALNLGFFDVLAWISCIQQLLGQTFMLAGLILGIRAMENRRPVFAALALSSYVLALLSLEQTYALPLILFFHSFSREKAGSASGRTRKALRETWAYLVIMAMYLVYMAAVKGVPGEGPYQYKLGANVIANLLTYLDWAFGISVVMPFVVDVKSTGLTAAHVLLVVMVIYNLAKGRKRIVLFSSAYYLLTILPVLFLQGHAFHLHNYVPAVGIALLAAPVVEDFLKTVREWKQTAAPAAAGALIVLVAMTCFTKVRANETNFIRPDLPLPSDFVLRRAVIAKNAFDGLRAKTRFDRPPRKLFMVYKQGSGWYKNNVTAALGRGSALRLFYSQPDLDVIFHDRGDTLSGYDPQDSEAFFFDHMGRIFTPEEIYREEGSAVRTVEPESR